MNPKTLIVYDEKAPDLAEAAQKILQAVKQSGVPVKLVSAAEAVVAEVLAAGLLVFGVCDADSEAYSELKRIFKGVNLAGRKAAFFFTRDTKGVKALKAALLDTDITFSAKDLDTGSKSADLAAWIKKAINS